MRILLLLGAIGIALVGCGEDIEGQIAQCKMSPDGARVGVQTCMSAHGYDYVGKDGCLAAVVLNDVHPGYCYEKRGMIRSARQYLQNR